MIVPAEHAKGRVLKRREDVSRVCKSFSLFCASASSAKSITVGMCIVLISILDKASATGLCCPCKIKSQYLKLMAR